MLDEIADDNLNQQRPEPEQCEVNFIGVGVKWPATDDQIDDTLKRISFKINSGEALAIVGHVGSGKVSLIRNNCYYSI